MKPLPSADELTQGIADALRDHALEAAVDLLRVLAAVDPRQAGRVCDTIQAAIARGEREGVPDAAYLADLLGGKAS